MCLQSLMKFHHCLCKILKKNQYALSMHKQNPLRITKGNNSKRIGPWPYFPIINVHLVDMSAKAAVRVDSPADALSMHKQNPSRITKGNNSNRIGP